MKKILAACTLFAHAFSTQAYELVARVSIEDEARWRFDIELANNDIDFTAFQMDITLDGEAELRRENMNSGELMHKHSLSLGKPKGHYCVMGYNLGNEKLKGKNGPLFSFFIDADAKGIAIDNIIFVKTSGSEARPDTCAEGADADGAGSDQPEVNKVVYDMKSEQTYSIDSRGIIIRNGGDTGQE